MEKRYRVLIFIILSFAAGFTFYREAIAQVFSVVIHRDGSSHGVFVPFLALYFLYLNFGTLKKIELKTDPRGVALMLVGLIFPLLNVGTFHIHFMAYTLVLSGLVMLMFGKNMFKHMAFPIFFLITTVPIPPDIYAALANYSRTIAFGVSLKILSFFNIPYHRVGWDIQLPNAFLEVAIGCSGIRYMISYFVFGIAYAYIMKTSSTARLVTVALTIPISHFASIMRLTIIFMMTHYVSPYWSQPKPHVWLSWFVFFSILFGVMFLDQHFTKRWEAGKLGGTDAVAG
ncbi:MAG: exosortase/archaeosortase family protein [Nitrospinales bacterium]